jgi:soluble lytic murein transglycosylase
MPGLAQKPLSRLALGLILGLIFLFTAQISKAAEPDGAEISRPELSNNDMEIYRRAFKAAHRRKFDKALATANTANDPLPAKAIRWIFLKSKHKKVQFKDITDFLDENPEWPHLKTLQRRAEEAMPSDFPPNAALIWFEKFPPITSKGATQRAEALLATGEQKDGVQAIRDAWIKHNFTYRDARKFRRKHRSYLRDEDHLARLDRLLWDSKAGAAKQQLQIVDKGHQRLAQARIELFTRGPGVDYAVARVPASLQDDPGLLYERIRWRRRHKLRDKALPLLETAPTENLSRPEKWWIERRIFTRRALRAGDMSVAYRLAKNHGQTGRVERAEAEWLAGWIALRFLHQYEEAFVHFKRLFKEVRYPVSQSRAAYWAGRAADAANETTIATQWYRVAAAHGTRFYGQLAAGHLAPAERSKLPPETPPSEADVATFQNRELVRLIQRLGQLGERKLAKSFLSNIIRKNDDPANWVLVGRLAHAVGRQDYAVHASRYALRQGVVLTSAGYPKLQTQTNAELDPALVHALIRQESAFDDKAISRAGARGLMQLMPTTALRVARKLKIRYSRGRLTQDPAYNIQLGQAYLKRMLDKFDGSIILALSAYNAGPRSAARWVRQNGEPGPNVLDMVDWIEQIPYTETRNYVQRVLENRTVYHGRKNGLHMAITLGENFNLAQASGPKDPSVTEEPPVSEDPHEKEPPNTNAVNAEVDESAQPAVE